MYKRYLAQVYQGLARQLAQSELDTVSQFYSLGYSVNYTIEYLK